MTANVGIAERADRLVAVLVATGLVGLGLPEVVLAVVLAPAGPRQPGHRGAADARRAPPGPRRRGVSRASAERGLARPRATASAGASCAGCPARARPTARSTHRRRRLAPRRRRACGGCGPTTPGCAPSSAPAALDALVREGMRSYLRYWCDAFRLPDWSPERAGRSTVRTEGDGPVREAAGDRRAARSCSSATWATGTSPAPGRPPQLAPVTTVAERLRPEEVFEQFLAFRESLGMRIIPLTGGGDVFRDAAGGAARRRVRAAARRPRPDPRRRRGRPCGEPARMAVGPAALAVATGAALHPVSVYYEPAAGLRGGRRHGSSSASTTGCRCRRAGTHPREGPAMTQACADVARRRPSASTRRTGTCCSGSSSTTSTDRARRPRRADRAAA